MTPDFFSKSHFSCFNSFRFCRENHVKLPPVQARFIYLTLLLFYKIKNKLSPMYLERLLPQACSTSSHYHLRGHNFPVPTVRSSRALKAFLPRSIILWNDLPPDIQALRTVASFKVARNEVKNASFAHPSAHRDSRIWRPELIEPAAERKRRARRRRRTYKSAYFDP